MAQLSPEFTARLVDEWRRLKEQVKNKPQLQIPQSYSEALALAAEQAKKIEEDAPKVAYAGTVLLASKGEPALDN